MGQQSSKRKNSVLLGIALSLIPLIAWGFSDYISSVLSKKIDPYATNLIFAIGGIPPAIAVIIFLGLPDMILSDFLKAVMASFILNFGFISMVRAFSHGHTGVVAPIANSYAIITMIIAVTFFDVQISLAQVMAVLITVSGIAILSYKKSDNAKLTIDKSVFYAILSMVLFGIGFAAFEYLTNQMWYQNYVILATANLITAPIIYLLLTKKDLFSKVKKVLTNKLGHLGGIVGGAGTIGLFAAFENVGNVAIPAAVAAASPLVTVLAARMIDKERLSLAKRAGMLIVVGGIVLLSIFS